MIPKTVLVKFHCRNLVLASGGKQKIPKNFNKKYELSKDTMVLISDEVLRERKFK
jgi:hypothetical protein